jgi:hypothetical protein
MQQRAAVRAKTMQRRSAAWLQIGAGERAWIPVRGGQKDAAADSSPPADWCRRASMHT